MLLAYATGGAAFLDFAEEVDTGFVVGGGLEYKLQNDWSLGGEALYYNFEDPNDADQELEIFTARARLTYHIGGRY